MSHFIKLLEHNASFFHVINYQNIDFYHIQSDFNDIVIDVCLCYYGSTSFCML